MKEFVKVAITRVDNVVLFKVIEQDETVIKRGEFKIKIDDVSVCSINTPQIDLNYDNKLMKIYLRGVDIDIKEDETICVTTLNNIKEADLLCKQIRNVINKLNEELNKKTCDTKAIELFEIVNY